MHGQNHIKNKNVHSKMNPPVCNIQNKCVNIKTQPLLMPSFKFRLIQTE